MVTTSSAVSVLCIAVLIASTVHSAAIKPEKTTTHEGVPPTVDGLPVLDRVVRSIDMPQKRPFCNAFTGCGRKRSGPEQMQRTAVPRDLYNSLESPNNLFDFNSEPAVADIMQQIMSEAKVWDAIQAANRELKKTTGLNMNNNYPTFSSQ